jgi:hypothetical protein
VETGAVEAFTSSQILAEVERVLLGSKFNLEKDEVMDFLGYFAAMMRVIAPKSTQM